MRWVWNFHTCRHRNSGHTTNSGAVPELRRSSAASVEREIDLILARPDSDKPVVRIALSEGVPV